MVDISKYVTVGLRSQFVIRLWSNKRVKKNTTLLQSMQSIVLVCSQMFRMQQKATFQTWSWLWLNSHSRYSWDFHLLGKKRKNLLPSARNAIEDKQTPLLPLQMDAFAPTSFYVQQKGLWWLESLILTNCSTSFFELYQHRCREFTWLSEPLFQIKNPTPLPPKKKTEN